MPLPIALAAPIIAGGAALTGQGINAGMQGRTNRQNIRAQQGINNQNLHWQIYQNQINRVNDLQDWKRVTDYNDPKQVMQRLRDAGLNTQLAGGANAMTPAPSLHSSAPAPQMDKLPPRTAPQIDMGNVINSAMSANLGVLDAQNKQAQNLLLADQHDLNQLNIAGTATKNARGAFELDLAKSLRESTITAANIRNQNTLASTNEAIARTGKIQTETGLLIPEFRLKQIQADVNNARTRAETKLAMEKLVTAQIDNMNLPIEKKNQQMKDAYTIKMMEYDTTLRQIGLSPTSNDYFTALARYLVQLGNNIATGFTR